MQYIKHYWVRNGKYLTEIGENGPLQTHLEIEGRDTKFWLTDERGVDYCLSTVPDHVLITEVDPGLKILTRQEWDAIVATIPEPEIPTFPEGPQEPNWDTFETTVLQSEAMKNFVSTTSAQNPLVASAFPAAFYEAKRGEYNSFRIVWNEITKISSVNPQIVASMIGIASACNLPQEFIDIIKV